MDQIIYVAIAIFIVFTLGGGIGFWLWWSLGRKRVQSWSANVYQLGQGIQPPIKKKGKLVANYRLADLVPYTKDTIIGRRDKSGATKYILKKLGKAVPNVSAIVVEKWGPKSKIVDVLIDGDTATLLKKGYDRKVAARIFTPMPHDRVTMIKTEMQERRDKIEQKKDTLGQITTWVVVGFWCLTLLSITYFSVNGFVKMSDNLKSTSLELAKAQVKSAEIYRQIYVDQNLKLFEITKVNETLTNST